MLLNNYYIFSLQIKELNAAYREILLITGSSPDQDRDYNFEKAIPETIDQLKTEYERLKNVYNSIKNENSSTSYISIINKLLFQLEKMYENPSVIAKNLSQFKSNIGSLGTWLYDASEQPLSIDKLYVLPADSALPDDNANFFHDFIFSIKCLLASYVRDYDNMGQLSDFESDQEIEVWIQSGRDQANVIRQIVDEKFAPEYGIKVNIRLVVAGGLLQSVLSNTGPDIAFDNATSDPINYALRGANIDLTQFDDFEKVVSQFSEAAMTPYRYDGKVYALPETLTFPMFFYRTDIFTDLGLEVPQTWDEMMALIPVLQRNQMSMAFPTGLTGYTLVLYKNGGELYCNQGETSNFDSDVALDSFAEFTDLFTLWQLPMSYSFENRFRTGEMPCGVVDYSIYNTLIVYAPEIKGQWNFVPIPGKEKGSTISVASGTNIMILKDCENLDAAWEFIKWWTGTEAQSLYGIGMESVLGSAAKHPTANTEALMQMSWTGSEAKNIIAAFEGLKGVPEVPGSYYTSRIISFALSNVYNNLDNPVEVLEDYNEELNKELKRKREEFGMQ